MENKQHLVYAGNVNLLDKNIHTIKNNRAALLVSTKETVLRVNTGRIKYMCTLKGARTGSLHKEM
jgi:hypothetical protein